jgi:hypothetical protein
LTAQPVERSALLICDGENPEFAILGKAHDRIGEPLHPFISHDTVDSPSDVHEFRPSPSRWLAEMCCPAFGFRLTTPHRTVQSPQPDDTSRESYPQKAHRANLAEYRAGLLTSHDLKIVNSRVSITRPSGLPENAVMGIPIHHITQLPHISPPLVYSGTSVMQ